MKKILFLALALLSAAGVFAQNPQNPGFAQPPSIDPLTGLPIGKPDTGPRFEIVFMGGTPQELISEIQKRTVQRPNVVIHPDCANISIPPFRLRDVSTSQIFNTLNTLSEPNYEMGVWRQVPMNETEVWILSKNNQTFGNPYGMPGMPRQAPPAPDRTCRVFNLGPYLDTFTVEDITTAIQGAWELMKNDNAAQSIKYHKDTKLLIVVGDKEQISLVNEVLQQLRSSIKPTPAAAPGIEGPKNSPKNL
jgi:hypothetical protein